MALEEKRSIDSSLTKRFSDTGLARRIQDVWATLSAKRDALGLSSPGKFEDVSREVSRDVFLNNFMFSGLRAELSKTFSASPMFQYSHGFSIGAQNVPAYNFMATYGNPKVFMHGSLDNEGQLAARANYRWTDSWVTKTTTQLVPGPGQAVFSLDNEYGGKDFTATLKAMNPSILDGGFTGILIGTYLQSITPALALGVEAFYQRTAMNQGPDSVVSYVAKYRGSDWLASALLQGQGALTTTYWRRLTERVDVGTELNLQFAPGLGAGAMMGGIQGMQATTAVGAKYDFRGSTFRAQIDSNGKIYALMEKRVAPLVMLTFAGELDQYKHQSKVGIAVSIDSQSDELMNMAVSGTPQPPPPPY